MGDSGSPFLYLAHPTLPLQEGAPVQALQQHRGSNAYDKASQETFNDAMEEADQNEGWKFPDPTTFAIDNTNTPLACACSQQQLLAAVQTKCITVSTNTSQDEEAIPPITLATP